MIRFKHFLLENFLVENRLDFIKSKNPTIDSSHDTYAKHRNASDIIDHFADNADPSRDKKYTQWIISQYKHKHIRQEDHPRIKDALSNFDKHKSKLSNKDINGYSNISHIEDAVEPHLGQTTSKKEQKRLVKSEGAELIHDGPNLTVHHLKTKEAACLYGANTKWCTAARQDNKFDDYNKDGPLYVIQDKHTGKKHQFHFESSQFMDEKDRDINLHRFVKKNPELKEVKQFRDSNHGMYFSRNEREFNDSMKRTLNGKNVLAREAAVVHPNASPEHIAKALDDDHNSISQAAAKHPNASHDNLMKALDNSNLVVRVAAAKHPNATREHIAKASNDEHHYVRAEAAKNPNASPEHITKALNDENWQVRAEAAKNPNASPEHITKALDDGEEFIRRTAATHPNASPEHITKALNDEHHYVRAEAVKHPNASPEHIAKALSDENEYVRAEAVKHPNASHNNIMKALDDGEESIRVRAINHPNASHEHITKALNDKHYFVRAEAVSHPNASDEHIAKALNDEHRYVRAEAAKRLKGDKL